MLPRLVSPVGVKGTFDYIRNTGLCVAMLVAAVYLERNVYGSPLFEIMQSSAYVELCDRANVLEGGLSKARLTKNIVYYYEGFKQRFAYDQVEAQDVEMARRAVGIIEYRKEKQRDRNSIAYYASKALYFIVIILLIANLFAWGYHICQELSPSRFGSALVRAFKVLDRSLFILLAISFTIPIFLGLYSSRDSLFGGAPASISEIFDHVDWLGDNDKVILDNYVPRCVVTSSVL